MIEPIFKIIKTNGQENETLAAMQDISNLIFGDTCLKDMGDAI